MTKFKKLYTLFIFVFANIMQMNILRVESTTSKDASQNVLILSKDQIWTIFETDKLILEEKKL